MKPLLFLCFILFTCFLLNAQSVGIGTETPDASAALEVSSTTQGMLMPRMTTAQREMIPSPVAGLLVYDITTNTFWTLLQNGKIGLGTTSPIEKLHVVGNSYFNGKGFYPPLLSSWDSQ